MCSGLQTSIEMIEVYSSNDATSIKRLLELRNFDFPCTSQDELREESRSA
jgi:hypothetical protein